jgi:hypothetical protein
MHQPLGSLVTRLRYDDVLSTFLYRG